MRMLPSDPGFAAVNELWMMYAEAYNSHMLFHIIDEETDLDLSADMERWEFIDAQVVLRGWMEALLDGLPAVYLEEMLKHAYVIPEDENANDRPVYGLQGDDAG